MIHALRTTIFFTLGVGLLFYFTGCRETEENYKVATVAEMYESTAKMIETDTKLSEILELEQKVMANPTDMDLRKRLGMVAVDTVARVILAVGVGVSNPKVTSPLLQKQQARQAALSDAARWTAYHLQWLKDGYSTNFGQISTTVPGGTIVKEKVLPDGRCVVLIQSPLQ